MHLISVDLPAPLSPSSASTSPWWTSRSTSSRASTAPKRLVAPRTASAGVPRRRDHVTGRLQHAEPLLEPAAHDVGLDGEHDDDADDDRLQERVDVEQVHAVADHADHQRADQRVGDVAPAAEEAGAADDHRGDRVELGQVAGRRRAGVEPARRDDRGDAGQQAAQHVDRDEHRPHRDAGAAGRLRVAADGVDPATPHQRVPSSTATSSAIPTTRNAEYGNQPIEPPPIVRTIAGMPRIGCPPDSHSARPRAMLERGQRDDERVRQPAPHVDAAVDEADRGARAPSITRMTSEPEAAVREDERADHRRQRQGRADRQVDAAGEDDEQLADRQDGDDRGLGQHVADVAGREEHRRQQRHRHDEDDQDQHRTEADHAEGDAQQSEVAAAADRRSAACARRPDGGRSDARRWQAVGADASALADGLAADTRQVGHRVVPPYGSPRVAAMATSRVE